MLPPRHPAPKRGPPALHSSVKAQPGDVVVQNAEGQYFIRRKKKKSKKKKKNTATTSLGRGGIPPRPLLLSPRASPVYGTEASPRSPRPSNRGRIQSMPPVGAAKPQDIQELQLKTLQQKEPAVVSEADLDEEGMRKMNALCRKFVGRWRVKTLVRRMAREQQAQLLKKEQELARRVRVATRLQAWYRGQKCRTELARQGIRVHGVKHESKRHDDQGELVPPLWYWDDPYIGDDYDSIVLRCTPTLLVCRLTHPKRVDDDLLDMVLKTHSNFLPTERLLMFLDRRFCCLPRDTTPEKTAAFERDVLPELRLKVLVVVRTWMLAYFYDFVDHCASEALKTTLHKWRDTCQQGVVRIAVDDIEALFHRQVSWHRGEHTGYNVDLSSLSARKGIIPRPLPCKTSRVTSALQIPSIEIARQLALLDFAVFFSVRPKEYLHQAWCKSGAELKAPNLLGMIDRYNSTSEWAVVEILRVQSLEQRVHVLCHLIDVAWACRELDNYAALMALLLAFQRGPVTRLKTTWEFLPEEHIARFEDLKQTMEMEDNYRAYRRRIKSTSAPAVPYLALALQDLTFIHDGNPTMIGTTFNLDKERMTARVIDDLMHLRSEQLCLQPQASVSRYLLSVRKVPEDKLYALSQSIEPRNHKPSRQERKLRGRIEHPIPPPIKKPSWSDGVEQDFVSDLCTVAESHTFERGNTFPNVSPPAAWIITFGDVKVKTKEGTRQQSVGDLVGDLWSDTGDEITALTAVRAFLLTLKAVRDVAARYPNRLREIEAITNASDKKKKEKSEFSVLRWKEMVVKYLSCT